MKRKLLSVLLVLCLAVCLLPVVALAAEDVSGYAKATSFAELKAAAADPGVTAINVINTEEGRILVTEDVDLTGKKLCVEGHSVVIGSGVTLTLGSVNDLSVDSRWGTIRVYANEGTLVADGVKLMSGSDAGAIFHVTKGMMFVCAHPAFESYPAPALWLYLAGDADAKGTLPNSMFLWDLVVDDESTLNVTGDLSVCSIEERGTINVAEGAALTQIRTGFTRQDIPAVGTAYASTQTVDLDGTKITLPAYALLDENGNPTNYVRLRDLADLLNGTAAQFDVLWSAGDGISLTPRHAYDHPNGSEGGAPFTGDQPYAAYLEDTAVTTLPYDLTLTAFQIAYEGGGHTYYQLRDLGKALGFNVGWSAERGIFLETDKTYTDAD